MRPEILDMCCGSRQFWFNPGDKRAVFCDIRCGEYPISDRVVTVRPDLVCDFRALPFPDASFSGRNGSPTYHITKATTGGIQ